jgi:hypothetical protein
MKGLDLGSNQAGRAFSSICILLQKEPGRVCLSGPHLIVGCDRSSGDSGKSARHDDLKLQRFNQIPVPQISVQHRY